VNQETCDVLLEGLDEVTLWVATHCATGDHVQVKKTLWVMHELVRVERDTTGRRYVPAGIWGQP
jgi:hypothetical protein